MSHVPCILTGPIGSRAILGLIVLQTDETIEQDFRRIFSSSDIALYVSRIAVAAEVSSHTLAAMETDIPASARLLPNSITFASIGYGCTSGATVIGPDRVTDLVCSATQVKHVSNPLSAAISSFKALGITQLGLVTPYVEEVSAAMRSAFMQAGISITAFASFNEQNDTKVARIDPQSIFEAAVTVGQNENVEAVFLSCTNLRTLTIIDDLEQTLNKPVISSNQALAWHMARASGLTSTDGQFGQLMKSR